jgi:glycosyltransferase involved in cell wall biosynthesis
VDDGSTGGAGEDAAAPFADGVRVQLIRFPQNRGKGHALLAGFRTLLEMPALNCMAVLDADGQHDPRELPRLHQRFEYKHADLLIGARTFDGPRVPWASVFGNKATRWVTHTWLGWDLPDTQSGYRLHSRRLIEAIVSEVQGGRYETEMEILVMALAGDYRVASEPIRTIYEAGNPTSHFRKLSDSLRIYCRLYRAVRRWRRETG